MRFRMLLLCGSAATLPLVDTGSVKAPQVVRVSEYPSADSALRVVEVHGGTLDMEGRPASVAFQIRASPLLSSPPQSRFVTITNCGGGLSPLKGQSVLKAAPGVSVYFFTLSKCLVRGPVDFSRFYNSTIQDVWMPTGGLSLTGAAFYNRFVNLYAGGKCLTATAPGGPSSGPNHNQIEGGRCQGTVTIGPNVQDWQVNGVAFEGCQTVCLSLAGTRLYVGNNRFECASPVGIDLLAGSDGTINTSYWSSCGVQIRFRGADPLAWTISSQPRS
jgi:hypothetical protein